MGDTGDLSITGTGDQGANGVTGGGAGAGGSAATTPQAWMAQLPDDLKNDEGLAKFSTIGDFAKAHKDLAGKAEGAVFIPGEGATDEEKTAFLKALGIPDNAEGYELKVDNLPEGLTLTEEGVKKAKELAHELSLNPKQAQGVFDKWNAEVAAQEKAKVEARTKSFEDGVAALKGEWKGEYDSKVAKAAKAIQTFGELAGVNLQEELARLGNADNNPVILRVFSAIGERISEDTTLAGVGSKESGQKTDALGRPLLTPESFTK
jgi:hypothetical protein